MSGKVAVETFAELEAWLALGPPYAMQIMISSSEGGGYEVGFVTFGALAQGTSKGATLGEALTEAASVAMEARDLVEEELPRDIIEAMKASISTTPIVGLHLVRDADEEPR